MPFTKKEKKMTTTTTTTTKPLHPCITGTKEVLHYDPQRDRQTWSKVARKSHYIRFGCSSKDGSKIYVARYRGVTPSMESYHASEIVPMPDIQLQSKRSNHLRYATHKKVWVAKVQELEYVPQDLLIVLEPHQKLEGETLVPDGYDVYIYAPVFGIDPWTRAQHPAGLMPVTPRMARIPSYAGEEDILHALTRYASDAWSMTTGSVDYDGYRTAWDLHRHRRFVHEQDAMRASRSPSAERIREKLIHDVAWRYSIQGRPIDLDLEAPREWIRTHGATLPEYLRPTIQDVNEYISKNQK